MGGGGPGGMGLAGNIGTSQLPPWLSSASTAPQSGGLSGNLPQFSMGQAPPWLNSAISNVQSQLPSWLANARSQTQGQGGQSPAPTPTATPATPMAQGASPLAAPPAATASPTATQAATGTSAPWQSWSSSAPGWSPSQAQSAQNYANQQAQWATEGPTGQAWLNNPANAGLQGANTSFLPGGNLNFLTTGYNNGHVSPAQAQQLTAMFGPNWGNNPQATQDLAVGRMIGGIGQERANLTPGMNEQLNWQLRGMYGPNFQPIAYTPNFTPNFLTPSGQYVGSVPMGPPVGIAAAQAARGGT